MGGCFQRGKGADMKRMTCIRVSSVCMNSRRRERSAGKSEGEDIE